MTEGITVDANVMKSFAELYIQDKIGEARTLVERIEAKKGFAIDVEKRIEQQWLDTCGSKPTTPFYEWFYERIKLGKIHYVRADLHFHAKKKLRIECGFPLRSDRYEIVYVGVANCTSDRYILTEDIHFFEPSLKCADEPAKLKAKRTRSGSVCKFLATLDITVGTVEQGLAELCLPGAPSCAGGTSSGNGGQTGNEGQT